MTSRRAQRPPDAASKRLLLAAGLLPLAAVCLAYLLAARSGFVPACNPFIDGCTSISSTGRHAPASYVFKPAHLLQAALLAVLWLRVAAMSPAPHIATALRWAGIVGAAALVVYTLTLGSRTVVYEFMRRFGIYVYFGGTLAAQLIATSVLAGPPAFRKSRPWYGGTMAWLLALTPLLLGLANFAGKAVLADPDSTQNRIEWLAALSMQAWFVWLGAGLINGSSARRR